MKVVGIDPSLTAPGIAVLDDAAISVDVLRSKPLGATIADRHRRLILLRDAIEDALSNADLVVIEQPAYSQTAGSSHDRSGLWWLIVDLAHRAGIRVADVPPTTLKKYAVGVGNASKEQVMWRVAREWPGVEAVDDNGADALWLAAMGRAHLDPDTALHSVTKARQATLKVVGW